MISQGPNNLSGLSSGPPKLSIPRVLIAAGAYQYGDSSVYLNGAAAIVPYTLPDADAFNGMRLIVFALDITNACTIVCAAGQTINTAGGASVATYTFLGADEGLILEAQGGDWYGIAYQGSIPPAVLPPPNSTGFVDRTLSTINFVDGTLTFTIAPTGASFDYYVQSTLITQVGADTVVITDTQGLWYFYYTAAGVLTASQTAWDIDGTVCFVATLYWDATGNTAYDSLSDERHSYIMDWPTHNWGHNSFGLTQRGTSTHLVANWTEGTGAADADAQIGLSDGPLYDEDIEIAIVDGALGTDFQQPLTLPAELPVWYRLGPTASNRWAKLTATDYPFRYAALGRYNWNNAGTWQQANVTDGNYFNAIIATSMIPVEPIFAIQGQEEYATQAEAEAEALTDLTLSGLPAVEVLYLYRLTYHTTAAYGNTPASRLVSVTRLDEQAPNGGVPVGRVHNSFVDRGQLLAHPASAVNWTVVQIDDTDSPYAVAVADASIYADGNANPVIANLPSAAGLAGQRITHTAVDITNACTLVPQAGEFIYRGGGITYTNAAPYQAANQYDCIVVESDGTNWYVK
jgi:hypothetical protein